MYVRHTLRRLTSRVNIDGCYTSINDRYSWTTSLNFFFSKNLEGVNSKVSSYRENHYYSSCRGYHDVRFQIQHERVTESEEPMVASAAQYYFKIGFEGKQFRPTVLLLMASTLNMPLAESLANDVFLTLSKEARSKQQTIAEIIEMIHVASLLHDNVQDDAYTSRGIKTLDYYVGNKIAIQAGNSLLSRACFELAALRNTEVMTLLSPVVEDLVRANVMQMTMVEAKHYSMQYYLRKTYYKSVSLISNSCKAIALLAGQTTKVSQLAYDYGWNLGFAFQLIHDLLDFTGTSSCVGKGSLTDIRNGIITAPTLFAMQEFPQLQDIIGKGFDNQSNIDTVLQYLEKSQGIQRTRDLATEHAIRATQAIESLPDSDDENVMEARRALTSLTQHVINKAK